MPNRIIKESICVSDNLDKLSWFEECLFYRLIVNCDDYGRFDGRAAVVKNRLFPLKDNVTTASVEKGLKALVNAELVAMYKYDGKPYLHLLTWGDHQQIRSKRSKYPAPEDGMKADDCNLQAHDIKCNQMISDVPVIQSESESESNPNPKTRGKRERFTPPTVQECEAFFTENGATVVQATRFHCYYAANGWKTGKNPMKDWQAAARGWILRDKEGGYAAWNRDVMQRHNYTPEQYRAMVTDLDAEDDSGKPKGKDGDRLLRYTKEERRKTYSAAELNLDEEE